MKILAVVAVLIACAGRAAAQPEPGQQTNPFIQLRRLQTPPHRSIVPLERDEGSAVALLTGAGSENGPYVDQGAR